MPSNVKRVWYLLTGTFLAVVHRSSLKHLPHSSLITFDKKVLCSTEHLIRFNLLCCSFLKRLHVVQHFTHRVCANHTVRQTISSREDLLSLTMNPDRWLNTPKKTKILKRNSCQVVFAATARNNGFPFHIINGKPHASDCPTCLYNTNFSWA